MRPHGFTLVEILVVLVILAIAAGAAIVVYDGDPRGAATREARRFAGAVEHAAMRAQSRSETLGVSAEGGSWRFWRRQPDSGQWHPLADDDVLAPHELPPPIRIAVLAYAGQPVTGNIVVPLRPTGRNEPYEFVLQTQRLRVILRSDPLNRVRLTAIEDATP